MSDVSVLWHEYERYEDLTRSLTADVILLKRTVLHLPGWKTVTKEEYNTTVTRLRTFVSAVVSNLSPEDRNLSPEELEMPGTLIEHIRQVQSGVLPRFIEELRELHQHLNDKERVLTERDLQLLDEISNSVHLETARVFRRLWRK